VHLAIQINTNHFACQMVGIHRQIFWNIYLLVNMGGHFFVILAKFEVQTSISPLSL